MHQTLPEWLLIGRIIAMFASILLPTAFKFAHHGHSVCAVLCVVFGAPAIVAVCTGAEWFWSVVRRRP